MVTFRPRDMSTSDPRRLVLAAFRRCRAVTPLSICEVVTTLVPVTGAAIVEMTDINRRELVCATDDVSGRLETLQFSLGEGPCVQAVESGRPVLLSDLREVRHTRWPTFAEAASHTPARALYSFPLQLGAINVGVLDLYRDHPGVLSAAELATALLCADVARAALLEFRTGLDSEEVAPQRWLTGMDLHQAEIHRATGMVMAQLEVSAEMALATLRAFAYTNDQTLSNVARQVVSRQLRFPLFRPVRGAGTPSEDGDFGDAFLLV